MTVYSSCVLMVQLLCILALYWWYNDCILPVYWWYSDCVFRRCTGGTVTVYSGCVLVVQ